MWLRGPDIWDTDKISALMMTAMETFGTCLSSLSFFDGTDEMIIAGLGYGTVKVPRSVSIAAHAVLSDDVFVVLDTHKVSSSSFCEN